MSIADDIKRIIAEGQLAAQRQQEAVESAEPDFDDEGDEDEEYHEDEDDDYDEEEEEDEDEDEELLSHYEVTFVKKSEYESFEVDADGKAEAVELAKQELDDPKDWDLHSIKEL